jgi:UDP-MurNAc hydroxylase
VRVTVLGHAGLLVETAHGSVLCDPWFVPAFHGSWFVFPRNDGIDVAALARPDYLYISHLHADHLDAPFLADHVDKATPVLLPDFPTPELRDQLAELGFEHFIRCPNGAAVHLGGLQVRIFAETAPSDGPIGDSALFLDDGTARLFDQNDCRPAHPDRIARMGPIDLHLLQFSGAMWWPVVYDLPADVQGRAAAAKRDSTLSRAVMYARAVGARHVIPSAGPPCFLDPELAWLNDVDRSPTNIFPDATVFLERLADAGLPGQLAVPGTVLDVADGQLSVHQPLPPAELDAVFTDKASYLRSYAADWADWLAKERASWPEPQPDLVGRLAAWWEPLLASAPRVRAAVGFGVLIRSGDDDVFVDFPAGQVRAWAGEPYQYRLELPRPLVELCVAQRAVDWSNSLMLSLRFRAWRPGEFNEELFSFLKSLNPERMAELERHLDERARRPAGLGDDEVVIGDYAVQRLCPHRRADLGQFGELDDDGCTLTCTLHGWQFDLESGDCLTSEAHQVRSRRLSP